MSAVQRKRKGPSIQNINVALSNVTQFNIGKPLDTEYLARTTIPLHSLSAALDSNAGQTPKRCPGVRRLGPLSDYVGHEDGSVRFL